MSIQKSDEFGFTLSLDEQGDWVEANITEVEEMQGKQPRTLGQTFKILRMTDVHYESVKNPVEKGEFEEASMFISRRQLKEKLDNPFIVGSRVAILCQGREDREFSPYLYSVEKVK